MSAALHCNIKGSQSFNVKVPWLDLARTYSFEPRNSWGPHIGINQEAINGVEKHGKTSLSEVELQLFRRIFPYHEFIGLNLIVSITAESFLSNHLWQCGWASSYRNSVQQYRSHAPLWILAGSLHVKEKLALAPIASPKFFELRTITFTGRLSLAFADSDDWA